MSLEIACGLVLLAGLTAYALFGGADFGAGFWMAFAFGRNRERLRAAMFEAMGPVWETNHVWLILVLVTLWTAFPPVFASIFTNLYIPLTLALVGIVFRGAAFAFRHYGYESGTGLPATGFVFSVASIVTPFAMGVCVGAVAGGELQTAEQAAMLDVWFLPFPLLCGLIALTITAFLTPCYMLIRPVGDLLEDFRRLAIAGSLALGAATTLAIPVAFWDAGDLAERMTRLPHLILMASAMALGVTSLFVLWRRLYALASFVAGATVAAVILAWAAAQYPFILLPDATLSEAAANDSTLTAFLIALPIGALFLVPSLLLLFKLFATAEHSET